MTADPETPGLSSPVRRHETPFPSIGEAGFRFLGEHLHSDGKAGWHVDAATLRHLEDLGASRPLLELLRTALGDSAAIELVVLPQEPMGRRAAEPGRLFALLRGTALAPPASYVFLGAFAFFAWSMSWYDLASVMLDSRAFISWLGLSYVLAFAATELFRRRSFQSVCLALAAALVFLSDAERHSALLAQGPPGTINWAALSPAACAVTGSGLACNAMVLMHKEFYLLLCLFTVLAGLYRPLARRLKRNWLSPSRGS